MKRGIAIAILGLIGLVLTLSYHVNRTRMSDADIRVAVDKLFYFSTIGFVHPKIGADHADLFACVASGKSLNAAQSQRYRKVYQAFLLSQQNTFAWLDAELTVFSDHEMGEPNNIGEKGIAGSHDHHDSSTFANFVDLVADAESLSSVAAARRAWLANGMYKDLLDFMVHMGPAVHSVGLVRDEPLPQAESEFAPFFAKYYGAMKQAQNATINSPEYFAAVDLALSAYSGLVSQVQDKIDGYNGPFLTTMSGRFLSLQTIAPRLKQVPVQDRPHNDMAEPCEA